MALSSSIEIKPKSFFWKVLFSKDHSEIDFESLCHTSTNRKYVRTNMYLHYLSIYLKQRLNCYGGT